MFTKNLINFGFPDRVLALLLLFAPIAGFADETKHEDSYFDHYYLQGGTYMHYTDSDDYTGTKIFTSLEGVKSNDWLYGLALFDNSFGQFSQYIYTGKSWNYHGKFEGFHTKLTAGFIHGYRGDYKDKIPLNHFGIGPAIIPGIGYDNGKFGADVIMLGGAGLLFTVGTHL
ncbi:hypothetical protein [Methylophaga sulfidovorans]|uniref:Sn-glycerol-3-phosphate transporter n=1 Tax=Methylophaga sulfidovorans TaxID=45496 RepID=A0A1I3V5T6_9GAMM|nr:hypothetical protein [Methylophaga sulfidovorans]SFJ90349.1 hypothetical protein SAMN04488079_102242 [Methylophaga sulfidovorans]